MNIEEVKRLLSVEAQFLHKNERACNIAYDKHIGKQGKEKTIGILNTSGTAWKFLKSGKAGKMETFFRMIDFLGFEVILQKKKKK